MKVQKITDKPQVIYRVLHPSMLFSYVKSLIQLSGPPAMPIKVGKNLSLLGYVLS